MSSSVMSWAARLGVSGTGSRARSRVESALADRHRGSPLVECDRCGMSVPDVQEIETCPGCGRSWSREETMAEVVPIKNDGEKKQRRTKKRLADFEKTIDELMQSVGSIEWDIGKNLGEVRRLDLWQESGDYKSFQDYCQRRFEFTKQTAVAYIRIAEMFSKEEASAMRLGHLRLLVSVPDEEERNALAEWARENEPTFRELAEQVKAKRQELGLDTERKGMGDSVLLTARLKPGVVAEGTWKVSKPSKRHPQGRRLGLFELGDYRFTVEDLGDEGLVVNLLELEG